MTNQSSNRIHCAIVAMLVLSAMTPAWGEDDLRMLRAAAIRKAAQSVADSIVRVEKFGVADAAGEVADDAPTVAIAVDDARHFIASSLVNRQNATAIVLVAADGTRTTAKVIASDDRRQLVLLEAADDLGVRPVQLNAEPCEVGQTVIAVGRIAGDGSLAVSSGILSAKDRLWGVALQTDARVSSVFYGGPLIDLRGQLLGVLVPAVPDDAGEDSTAWYDSGVAFAIPAAAIGKRLARLVRGENIHPGLVGIVAKSNDPYVEFTEISAVRPRSPAALAEMIPGDVVQSVAGIAVRSHREIKQILGTYDAGETVMIEIRRGDETINKEILLAESIPPLRPQWIGITARDENADDKQSIIVTGLFAGGPAEKVLLVGDQIQAAGGSKVDDVSSLRRRVFTADPEAPIAVTVLRQADGESKTIELSIQPTEMATAKIQSTPDSVRYNVNAKTKWVTEDLTLPDVANKGVVFAPELKDGAAPDDQPLGFLMVMADPGETDLKKAIKPLSDLAAKSGVIVCMLAPANDARWNPEEIDVPVRVLGSLKKTYPVDELMTAVTGSEKGAGGSMAMAVAIGRPGAFAGLAIHAEVRPPAVRLVENNPSAPLQILIQAAASPDEPLWAAAIAKAGYVIVRDDAETQSMLRWIRSLPRI